ncbi:MAG: amidohydrolase family protein [Gemmatimonadota bacterium]|uniref:amidohydrolase family protein n=1 Tax=Candidatus Palauibacter scopulicola TaxID=3056741 RepID=UPI00238AF289|nr:amidohydrolase family protein [Candidatus Palauibacter scopulicola]MDE2662035.1 amidohydrolase family protein [Candidatus Palauibacter scopulicola]
MRTTAMTLRTAVLAAAFVPSAPSLAHGAVPAIAVAGAPAMVAAHIPAAQEVTAIRAGRLIDGTGQAAREDQVIIVRDERIEAVGDAAAVAIPAGARVVDLSGHTVMPGIVDAHAHLSIRPDIRTLRGQLEGMEQHDAMQMARIVRNIRVQLMSGVTSVYVVGEVHYNDIQASQAVEEGIVPGPRIYPSGNFISTTAGHGPAEYRTTNGPWEMRTFVRQNYEMGAHHMKLTITDRARVGPNNGTPYAPGESNYTKEEIDAAVNELHRLGIEATAHANGESIRLAVEAGVNSIQHGGNLNEELMDLMASRDVGFVNTYTIGYQSVFNEWGFLDNEAGDIRDWLERGRQVHEQALEENPGRAQRRLDRLGQLRRSKEKGVKVGIGTDSMHGYMLLEMENLVAAGFTPLEAITAATGLNAEIVGIEDEVGTVEAGRFADIIAIDGRPDENIRDLGNVAFIMVGGRDQSALSFR